MTYLSFGIFHWFLDFQEVVKAAYGKILLRSSSAPQLSIQFCPLANVSNCPASESSKQVEFFITNCVNCFQFADCIFTLKIIILLWKGQTKATKKCPDLPIKYRLSPHLLPSPKGKSIKGILSVPIRNLGITFNPRISFSNHISMILRFCIMHIHEHRSSAI